MVGAPALAANAALRSGAGLVKIACPRPAQQTIAGLAPCATSMPLPATADGKLSAQAQASLRRVVSEHDVVAFGPGAGQGRGLRSLLDPLIALDGKPIVIDADGLNNLAAIKNWWTKRKADVVLTPHPGEMARLVRAAGMADDLRDRPATAAEYARLTDAVCVLKGAGTLVTDGRRCFRNKTGNPGMAVAGTGDVLTGIIAALIGQGLTPFDAAVKGVHVHGLAGDIASRRIGEVSLIATDLIDELPAAFKV